MLSTNLIKFFLLLQLAFLFSACNGNDENKAMVPNNISDSEAVLKKVVAEYPDSSLAVENLAQYYQEKENYDAAIATIRKQSDKDSRNHRWYNMMAWLYYEKDDTTNAIREYEKAISLYPDPQYVIAVGALYAGRGNPQALDMAEALIEADKANAKKEAYFIEGIYYNTIGDKTAALKFFDRCLQESYTFTNAYVEKALVLRDLKQYDLAVETLDKGIAVQNNFPEAYYFKGEILELLNKKQDASEAYRKALFYDNNYVEAQDAINRLTKN